MKEPPSYEPDPMAKRETLEFVRAHYKISDPKIRKRLFELERFPIIRGHIGQPRSSFGTR